jgi:rhodanese-related sulfurtransferase
MNLKYIQHSIVASFSLVLMACSSSIHSQTVLDANAFETAIEKEGTQILDVRTLEEYNDNHIKNSLQANWYNKSEFNERIVHLDSSKPVYVYCLSGGRSRSAANYLAKNGFTTIELSGGINAWAGQNKDLVPLKKVEQLSLDSLNSLIGDKKISFIDFGAKWCAPCVKMQASLDSFESKYENQIYFTQIDGGEQTEILKALNIASFPTQILYKDGKEVWRHKGILRLAEMEEQVKHFSNN